MLEEKMPTCKRWGNIDTCGGHLIKSNWLPSSGEDPTLREYKCEGCGNIIYSTRSHLEKVRTSPTEKVEQGILI